MNHQSITDHCPYCNTALNTVTSIGKTNIKPKNGDSSLCHHCASILKFDHNLKLIAMTTKEIANLEPDHLAFLNRGRALILKRVINISSNFE